jgi:hypothetical protein
MTKTQKNILIWLVILVLVIVTTPWFGSLYEMIIGRKLSSGFWGPSNPEYITGFFMALFFFSTLILVFIRESYKRIFTILAILVFIDVLLGGWWQGLFFDLASALLAWIIAQGILLLKKILYPRFKN